MTDDVENDSHEALQRDAARWRALMSCGRMRFMGSAGFDLKADTIVPRAKDTPLHMGVEFWDVYGSTDFLTDKAQRAALDATLDKEQRQARGGLTNFVDELLRRAGAAARPDDLPPYLIWSNEHGAWWRPNSAGYTSEIERAGRYTRAQAIDQCAYGRDGYTARDCPSEIPVRFDAAMARGDRPVTLLVRPEDHTECIMRDKNRRAPA